MTLTETDRLLLLVSRKHGCLNQLHELGHRQLMLIQDEDLTTLLQVLGVKQSLIEDLNQVERELDPFRPQQPHQRHWRSEADRVRCAELLQGCDQLLAAVVRQEQASEQLLCVRRDETAARLQGVHHANQARGAYAAEQSQYIGHLDLSTES